jgi:homoserine kinase
MCGGECGKGPREFQIQIPGSIANLGPGFDTLAVAVQLYLTLDVNVQGGHNELTFEFRDCHIDGENYIDRSFRFAAAQGQGDFPSLHVRVSSDIPTKGGLGSSAAATVGGLRLYEAIAGPLPAQGLLNAACALEGHPDNVAASLLGGLTVSCELPDRSAFALNLRWPEALQFIVVTPQFTLSTSDSRNVLPAYVAHQDAVFNVQRVALLLQALQNGDFALLREALHDRLHQPYRQKLVPGLQRALSIEHPDLVGICLSGAGPSVVALASRNFAGVQEALENVFHAEGIAFTVRTLRAHHQCEGVLNLA